MVNHIYISASVLSRGLQLQFKTATFYLIFILVLSLLYPPSSANRSPSQVLSWLGGQRLKSMIFFLSSCQLRREAGGGGGSQSSADWLKLALTGLSSLFYSVSRLPSSGCMADTCATCHTNGDQKPSSSRLGGHHHIHDVWERWGLLSFWKSECRVVGELGASQLAPLECDIATVLPMQTRED